MKNSCYKKFSVFDKFSNLFCYYSNRNGGFSRGIYSSLNLGIHTGDDKKTVLNNRDIFFKATQADKKQIAFPEQVHSNIVKVANVSGIYRQTDALISNRKNIFLSVQTADCTPLFLFDPVRDAIAIIHAGWRGAQKGIIPNTIQSLNQEYSVNPKDIVVAIGPALQKECFEVREDVYSLFPDIYLLYHKDHDKRILNLTGFIMEQLTDNGVKKENIEIDYTCTHCASDLYYSYRRDKNQSGRMMGLIGLTK